MSRLVAPWKPQVWLPPQQAVGWLTVPLTIVGARREDDILVAGAAPQRLRPHASVDLLAIALPQAFDIEFEVRRRAPLQRAVDRRPPAFGLVVVDFGPVGRAAAGEIGDEEAVAADRILIVEPRVGEVDQRADLAAADVPAIADQQLGVGLEVLATDSDRSPQTEPAISKPLKSNGRRERTLIEAGEAGLDQIGGRRLERLDAR